MIASPDSTGGTDVPINDVVYISPETGEIVRAETPGAIPIYQEEVCEPRGATDEPENLDWLPGWWLRKQCHIEAELEVLEAQYRRRRTELFATRRYLEFRYQGALEDMVRERLVNEGSRRKSLDVLEGRMGFRHSKRIEIVDEGKALAWAEENLPSAVKTLKSLLVSKIPPDARVPGVQRIERDVFYYQVSR